MNYERFAAYVDADNKRRRDIMVGGKGVEYTDGDDALSNFKLNAVRMGLHPVQVLTVYMYKHINSVETYLKQFGVVGSMTEPADIQDSAEGIGGRIDDLCNYLELLACLLRDMEFIPEDPVEPARESRK